MNKLINYLDELLESERLSKIVEPKDKEIKFEYYSTKDDKNNDYVKSVEITIDSKKNDFSVPSIKPKASNPLRASLAVTILTANCLLNSFSVGSLSPGLISSLRINSFI